MADVSNSGDVEGLFQKIEADFGEAASIVVNCAGISNPAPFLKMTEEQFDKTIAINLKVRRNISHIVVTHMYIMLHICTITLCMFVHT